MRPKFINALYFEGRILMFEEYGDVYEFSLRSRTWHLVSRSPWPQIDHRDPSYRPAEVIEHIDGDPDNNHLDNLRRVQR